MNNEFIEKRKFDEILTKYELEPSLVDIYVEGAEDESFYSYHLDRMGKNLRFIDISTIIFPETLDLTTYGLENNNRDKVIFLISKMNELIPGNSIYGIIDRDILNYTRGFNSISRNIFLTDFSCLEMYFFSKPCIEKVKKQTFRFLSEKIIRKIQSLAVNYSLIVIAEKKLQLSLRKISPAKLCNSRYMNFKDFSFDLDKYLKGCLALSNLNNEYDSMNNEIKKIQSQISLENPINFINGHIFINILTGFIMQHKAFNQIKEQEVCNIYKNAVETVFLEELLLFKKLSSL